MLIEFEVSAARWLSSGTVGAVAWCYLNRWIRHQWASSASWVPQLYGDKRVKCPSGQEDTGKVGDEGGDEGRVEDSKRP